MPSTSSEDLSPKVASALIERLSKAQEARRRQRLFYRLFPKRDMVEPDGRRSTPASLREAHGVFRGRGGVPGAVLHGGQPGRQDLRRRRI